jgi:hypothetical protein
VAVSASDGSAEVAGATRLATQTTVRGEMPWYQMPRYWREGCWRSGAKKPASNTPSGVDTSVAAPDSDCPCRSVSVVCAAATQLHRQARSRKRSRGEGAMEEKRNTPPPGFIPTISLSPGVPRPGPIGRR